MPAQLEFIMANKHHRARQAKAQPACFVFHASRASHAIVMGACPGAVAPCQPQARQGVHGPLAPHSFPIASSPHTPFLDSSIIGKFTQAWEIGSRQPQAQTFQKYLDCLSENELKIWMCRVQLPLRTEETKMLPRFVLALQQPGDG